MHDLNMKKEAPLSAFILLLVLYTLATFFTIAASRTRGTIVVFDNQVAIASFAGAFSSMSNICVICLAVLFRKPGFIISLILLLLQFPMMIINIFLRHVTTNLPGLFMNFFTIIAVIIIYVSHRKVLQYQKGIRDQAIKDRLTGLPNRFATTELLEDMVKHNEKFALVAIDLNNFKSINDTMGHETGNVVLQRVADRWVRLSDSMKNGVNVFVSRISGDEYLLLISGYSYSEDIEKIINEFKNELERKMTIDECDYFLTACYGYTEFPADDDNVDSLLLFADAALHEAKRMSTTSILKFKPDLLRSGRAHV